MDDVRMVLAYGICMGLFGVIIGVIFAPAFWPGGCF